jgi:hypothetical protein
MKIHAKKKAYQKAIHELAHKGLINLASGQMVQRDGGQSPGNQMRYDYHPQESGHKKSKDK